MYSGWEMNIVYFILLDVVDASVLMFIEAVNVIFQSISMMFLSVDIENMVSRCISMQVIFSMFTQAFVRNLSS